MLPVRDYETKLDAECEVIWQDLRREKEWAKACRHVLSIDFGVDACWSGFDVHMQYAYVIAWLDSDTKEVFVQEVGQLFNMISVRTLVFVEKIRSYLSENGKVEKFSVNIPRVGLFF
jgi:hypothetical protein